MKMKVVVQTKNPVLRVWGNLCGSIADIFLNQSLKYGDMYEVENFLEQLDNLDNTFAWKDDD